MIKVLIADDIFILRQGLKAILEQDGGIEVVGMAENGKQALEICVKKQPDVVLMDMRMPEFDGSYGTREIKRLCPSARVLVLTTFDDEETVAKAVNSGADGYILKETDNERLISAIKTVAGGVNVFGANIYSQLCKKFVPQDTSEFDITPRERQIISLIIDGLDNKEIAAKLFLAEGTVRNSISRLLEKLKLKDRTQLAVFGVKNNIG